MIIFKELKVDRKDRQDRQDKMDITKLLSVHKDDIFDIAFYLHKQSFIQACYQSMKPAK